MFWMADTEASLSVRALQVTLSWLVLAVKAVVTPRMRC